MIFNLHEQERGPQLLSLASDLEASQRFSFKMDSTSGGTEASTSAAVDGLNTIVVIGGEGIVICLSNRNEATNY